MPPSRIIIMRDRIVDIVESVIARADRERPADALLRHEIKDRRSLLPEESRAAAELLFAYYRWCGWADQSSPIQKQLATVQRLAERFARSPRDFAEADLRRHALPEWVQAQVDISVEFLRALQTPPSIWLRARTGTGAALAQKLPGARIVGDGLLADSLEYRGTRDLFRTVEFHAGEFELQDISSQAVGWLCSPQSRQTWWDACAGEGGKTLHLSDLMRNTGLIWASDRNQRRLLHLKRRAARAKVFNYRAELWNGGARLPTKTKFDGILIDAPCTGVGTWHRNPHARWTTTLRDVEELGAVQEQLLTHAVPALKPGGRLIYSVCTLTRRETREVTAAIEKRFPELEPLAVGNPLSQTAATASQQWMWPQDRGGNGMFVAIWRKR